MKVIMTKGLPASGKSTWAKKYIDTHPGAIRLNKDDMRAMYHNGRWSKPNEAYVLEMRDFAVTMAIMRDQDVIVDDTNLEPKHEATLRKIVEDWDKSVLTPGKKPEATFEVKEFYIPPTEAEARDAKRENGVGPDVIRRMWRQYICKPVPTYNPDLPDLILCDIDGTVAHILNNRRSVYDNSLVHTDVHDSVVKSILDHYIARNDPMDENATRLIFCSGRKDECRDVTEKWLNQKGFSYYDKLLMRKTEDNRHDWIVKREIYEAEIKGKYNVLFVLDDRNQVVDMWREEGLKVLQVADGCF